MNNRSFNTRSGVAFLELALLTPLILLLTLGAWDVFVGYATKIVHRKAAIAVARDFAQAPLRAVYTINGGNPQIEIRRLTLDEATSAAPIQGFRMGFLPALANHFEQVMSAPGSGATSLQGAAMIELRYLQICSSDTATECDDNGRFPGAAFAVQRAGEHLGTDLSYFRTGNHPCFDNDAIDVRQQLSDYADRITNNLLSYTGGTGSIRVGTLLLDVDTGHPALGRIKAYAPWKPVIYWALCSIPPRIFNRGPVVTLGTYFPDREVSYGQ